MFITAAIITYNEEKNIARCLSSLQGVVDEVIVMDSFSTDETQQICADFGVTFYQQEWQGYAKQKNDLNALAKHEMILSIDADEVLSPRLQKAIINIKNQEDTGVFSVSRLTNYCGQWIYHSGWYPDIKVRLFPITCSWEGDWVHEELMIPEGEIPRPLEGHLEHYSYTSHVQHRERADRYSTLTAHKYVASGKRPYPLRPMMSSMGRFIKMYFFKQGFLDGMAGFHIARISAQSNFFKYQEVKRLYDECKNH